MKTIPEQKHDQGWNHDLFNLLGMDLVGCISHRVGRSVGLSVCRSAGLAVRRSIPLCFFIFWIFGHFRGWILEHTFDPFSVIFSHFLSFFPPSWHFVIFGHIWLFLVLFTFYFIFIVSFTHSCPFQSFLESFCVIFRHFVIFPQNDSKSCFVIFEHFKGWAGDIKVSYQF